MAVLSILMAMPEQAPAAAPELSFSAIRLRFADVVVGQTETLLVVATNNGQSKVTISGVRSTNSNFKASTLKLPQVLAPGKKSLGQRDFRPHRERWGGRGYHFD
ncbi:MAG: hypothetical protein WA320_02405 [Candidatus Sulfotelmatobacter sp.]